MGNCQSIQDLSNSAIRQSWIGSYLLEIDIFQFPDYCSYESQKAAFSADSLSIDTEQCFYLVLSGEVAVYLTNDKVQLILVSVYRPGDTIFLLPGLQDPTIRGSLLCGKTKLTFQLRATKSNRAQVMSISRSDMRKFLTNRPHLKVLHDLCLTDRLERSLRAMPSLQSLTIEQIQVLMTVMKVSHAKAGQVVKLEEDPKRLDKTTAYLDRKHHPTMQEGYIGIVLKGRCGRVTDQSSLLRSLTHPSAAKYSQSHVAAVSAQSIRLGKTSFNSVLEAAEQKVCESGTFLGLEHCFVEKNTVVSLAVVALEDTWIAQVAKEELREVFRAEPLIKRALRRNYIHSLLSDMRYFCPLLRDMDDHELGALAGKVELCGYGAGEEIFRVREHATQAFLVVKGSIQERQTNRDGEVGRKIASGGILAPTALVTDGTYPSSSIALESTIVACISKRSLDQVYEKNKTKLAEICIRLAGQEVDLEHVVAHPTANGLLRDFLRKERSEENILFYNAVLQYEELLERLRLYLTNSLPISDWKKLLLRMQREEEEDDGDLTDRLINKCDSLRSEFSSPSLRIDGMKEEEAEEEAAEHEKHSKELALNEAATSLKDMFQVIRSNSRSILESFILTNASHEVNLPERIRNDTVNLQQRFMQQSDAVLLEMALESIIMIQAQPVALEEDASTSLRCISLSRTLSSEMLASNSTAESRFVPGRNVFRAAKAEIFRLLRTDAFLRWKRCREFLQFISSSDPYEMPAWERLHTKLHHLLGEQTLHTQAIVSISMKRAEDESNFESNKSALSGISSNSNNSSSLLSHLSDRSGARLQKAISRSRTGSNSPAVPSRGRSLRAVLSWRSPLASSVSAIHPSPTR
eukprot:scaffold537_cov180-Ochromonas_danica.AAC.31